MQNDTVDVTSFAMRTEQKICDPIHGFIRLTAPEVRALRTRPFQRLHSIGQLGMTYHVYPGARHTRFEHSLGVMELASKLYLSIFSSMTIPRAEFDYWHQVVRLAALCHDLGHLPFSHTAEGALLGDKGHERMSADILMSSYMDPVWEGMIEGTRERVLRLSLSPQVLQERGMDETLTPWQGLLARLISDDNFGADRIDYLLRDAYFAGVHFGSFDHEQLIDSLAFVEGQIPQLAVSSSGIQAVESLWIARYLMYSRLYFHPKVRLYGIQMSQFMQAHYAEEGKPSKVSDYLEQTDATILEALQEKRERSALNQALYDGRLLYEEVPLEGLPLSFEDLETLVSPYSEGVFIDRLGDQMPTRSFPVITGRETIVSSLDVAPFLNHIPYGHQTFRVYALPQMSARLTKAVGAKYEFSQ